MEMAEVEDPKKIKDPWEPRPVHIYAGLVAAESRKLTLTNKQNPNIITRHLFFYSHAH